MEGTAKGRDRRGAGQAGIRGLTGSHRWLATTAGCDRSETCERLRAAPTIGS